MNLRGRIITSLLTSPVTMIPGLLGFTLAVSLWVFNINTVSLILLAVGAMIIGVGTFFSRLIIGDEAVKERVISEIRAEEENVRNKELDELEFRLKKVDANTCTIFQDMRQLVTAFRAKVRSDDVDITNLINIETCVEDLFNTGINMLKQSLELNATANKLNDKKVQKQLLKQREKIILDLKESLDKLGELWSNMQADSETKTVVEELSSSLEIAQRVKERMLEFHRHEIQDLKRSKKEMAYV